MGRFVLEAGAPGVVAVEGPVAGDVLVLAAGVFALGWPLGVVELV
jgi:hypothetical protein